VEKHRTDERRTMESKPPKKRRLVEDSEKASASSSQGEADNEEELDENQKQLHEYLKVAVDAAREAAVLVKERFYETKNVQFKKSAVDLVTEVSSNMREQISID